MQTNLQNLNDKLHSLSSRERSLLIIVFALAVFVLFWQFVYQPYEQKSETLKEEIELVSMRNEQILGELDDWEEYQATIEDQQAQLQELERELPGYPELEFTFYQIATVLYQRDIDFDTIFFELNDIDDNLQIVELQGNFQGSYLNIVRTFEELEEMDRLINTTSLSITALDDSEIYDQQAEADSQEVRVAFEMEFYWDDIAASDPNKLDPEQVDMGKLDPFMGKE